MKIRAPNKQYSGFSAGVAFAGGVGETDDPRLLAWFRSHGYTIEEGGEAHKAPKTPKVPKAPKGETPGDPA